MGLGSVKEGNGVYLSVAGGFIWDRKAEKSNPNYAEQSFVRADKTEGVRAGARYADLTGRIVGVQFKTHDEYGESINVTVDSGEDRFIMSISTNNRYSQDMMKALLKMDLTQDIFIKPYDFVGSDKKRAQGISFRQGGEKLALRVDEAPSKEGEWFKSASKKQIKRFFEDLSDWYVAEVEEKVCPKLSADLPEKKKSGLGTAESNESTPADKVEEAPVETKTDAPKMTQLKMKKALKAYIAENYDDKELPKLSKEDVVKWYELSLKEEELPFGEDEGADVSEEDLDKALENLI